MNSDKRKTLSNRLRNLRITAGFRTAQEFSDHYKIEAGLYRSNENGHRAISKHMAEKYGRVFAKPPSYFLYIDQPLENAPINTVNTAQSLERDIGLLGAIKLIFAIMTKKDMITDTELDALLNHQLMSFQRHNQPGAIEVMEQLQDALGLKPSEPQIQQLRGLLKPLADRNK